MSLTVPPRRLLGLSDGSAALKDSVLVAIDCQNTYRQGAMRLEGVAGVAGIPVLQVMHDGGKGSPYNITAPIGRISEEVAPLPGSHSRSTRLWWIAWPMSVLRDQGPLTTFDGAWRQL